MAQYEIRQERMCRIFNIIGQLSPFSQVTVHDLAAEYNVDERTIQRDIEVLERAELGVFQDENSCIKIGKNGYKKIKSWISG
ncbi:MAG: HTH domain-containing protein [Nitrospirae bacterium]|nr:HTH domain-containing protein [Nitrospirota bacterium]